MPAPKALFKITAEMEEYIKSRSSDLRICTTCEGPLLFSVKVAPPKATDLVEMVGNRKLYISAVQAPFIKAIDTRLLPKCALINKARDAGKSYPCK